MTPYTAPIRDMMFTLTDIVGLDEHGSTTGLDHINEEMLEAIYAEGGKLISGAVAPINQQADQEGMHFDNGEVRYPESMKKAWREYVAGGWPGLGIAERFGGQAMGQLGYCPFHEMMTAGSLSFVQAPGLTIGAVEAIQEHASEELQQTYCPRLASGEWTGTMNLTEPQAGSDVGALKTKAVAQADGSYNITGNKIYITCGEHDLAENIIHLVLARVEGAPEGSRGISLFLVPKFLLNADGSVGEQNDVRCTGIEHKLGLRGSPACSMSYGDNGGATGWIIGEENKGLACMFTMMNYARLHVGLHGTGCAERAYQAALAYSTERVQGVPIGTAKGDQAAIINHADVRRMLMTMRAKIAASRAICLMLAKALDLDTNLPQDSDERKYWRGISDLLTPLSKAYSSDIGVECCSDSVQVFGGMGFIEETGAAQLYRDVRIAPIYEGTNGIQAWDLANRKLKIDQGQHWQALLVAIEEFAAQLDGELQETGKQLLTATSACRATAEWFLQRHSDGGERDVAAGSVAYQRLMSETVGAWLLARGAHSAQQRIKNGAVGNLTEEYLRGRVTVARFFAEHLLPQSSALAFAAQRGDELVFADSDAVMQSS